MRVNWFGYVIAVFLMLASCAIACAVQAAFAEERAPGEYQVKAAILYNFAKFVEWPADAFSGPLSPIVIGILGDDPFGSALDAAKEKVIRGRKVQVLRSERRHDLSRCHILFISSSERGSLPAVLKEFQGSRALLVGDMDKFASRGGMVGLVMRNDMVDFEINVDAVQRAGIKVNERLLNTARIVRDQRRDSTGNRDRE